MKLKTLIPALLIAPWLLSGCASQQTSVEKTAHHAAVQLAQLNFDPNMRPLTADNTRVMTRFFTQFYVLGEKDRAEGLSREQAEQRVNSFSSDEADGVFSPARQKSGFLTQQYASEQPEKRGEILKKGAITTYWDGYNGKP